MSWAIINEDLMPLSEARVPLNDRSFLFGDSLYEVIATYEGHPFFISEHLKRLRLTAAGIHLDLPWSDAWFRARIKQGLEAMPERHNESIYIRIVISRGGSDFNIDTHVAAGPPQAYFVFKSLKASLGKLYSSSPVSLAIPQLRRNAPNALNPAFKTGNYLNNVLGLYEAQKMGAMNALMLDMQGRITESTTSNFFCVRQGTLWTPPTEVGILHGITRKILLELAENIGIPTRVEDLYPEDLSDAEEAFISNTLSGLRAVNRVDDYLFPASLGPVSQKLADSYWQYLKEHRDHV